MEPATLDAVFSLSVEERLRLVQAIWDSVTENPEDVHLSDAQRKELEQCYREYLENPVEGSSWTEVKARLHSRK